MTDGLLIRGRCSRDRDAMGARSWSVDWRARNSVDFESAVRFCFCDSVSVLTASASAAISFPRNALDAIDCVNRDVPSPAR